MHLSMELLLKPLQVSHLVAKCELELGYKLLTVLQMRRGRKNIRISHSSIHNDLTTRSVMLHVFFRASVPGVVVLLESLSVIKVNNSYPLGYKENQ